MTKFVFRDATKSQLKARIAFAGPSGSGKTLSALKFARVLAGPTGRILVVDTERGSASLYADRFAFQTYEFTPPYDVRTLTELIQAAGVEGFDVLVIDSLSHFWSAEGGLLDFVDAQGAATFQKGWKAGTPVQNRMVDAILAYPGHVVVTMRAKTEYVIEKVNGKDTPRKVGMAPVQRDGIEYEFTLTFDVDYDHNLHVSKSRCSEIAAVGVYRAPEVEKAADTFLSWLTSGEAPTVDATAAKKRLVAAFTTAGWADVQDARGLAAQLWKDAGLEGDRIDAALFESVLGQVRGPQDNDDTDPWGEEVDQAAGAEEAPL